MKEEFVSYEIARKLKECGFDWEICEYYTHKHNDRPYRQNVPFDHNTNDMGAEELCSAPPTWMAQKWLRDVKGINVRVNYLFDEQRWFADWIELGTRYYDSSGLHFRTYEEALSDGIDTVLFELTQDEE